MDVLHPICGGLDVHRDTVVATIRKLGRKGDALETRTFSAFPDGLAELSDWLDQHEVPIVGMESTGVYFKPVYRALRARCPSRTVLVFNASSVKQVRGRKTDVNDSAWLSTVVMHGLAHASLIPEAEQEDLRRITRYRTTRVQDRSKAKNRIIKLVEREGIKLASVCTDVLGKSGRQMLEALVAGDKTPEEIAELARGRLRAKKVDLVRALQFRPDPTTCMLLRRMLDELARLDAEVLEFDALILKRIAPHQRDVDLLKQIPGINDATIGTLVAEIGVDMSLFPSANHLASWGGFAPGSHQSAGLKRNVPAREGNRWLRSALVQAAQVAARNKRTPWREFFLRVLRNSANYNKAVFAVARKLAVTVYCVLRDGEYRPLQPRAMTERQQTYQRSQAVRQLESLGYTVTLATQTTPT